MLLEPSLVVPSSAYHLVSVVVQRYIFVHLCLTDPIDRDIKKHVSFSSLVQVRR